MMAEYIEREAAAKLIKSVYIEDLIAEWYEAEFDNVYVISKKELLDIPAADVRPVVKAKWELDSDKLPICSNCGEIALQRIFVKTPHLIQDVRMVRSNFCPNCGADMKEES